MADVVITAANVVPDYNTAKFIQGRAGETITQGMPVYLLASTGKYMKAQADASDSDAVVGIAINGASDEQKITIQITGKITIGGTVAVGHYVLSAAAAGGIAPVADLVSTNYLSSIGNAVSTSVIDLNIQNTGVALA